MPELSRLVPGYGRRHVVATAELDARHGRVDDDTRHRPAGVADRNRLDDRLVRCRGVAATGSAPHFARRVLEFRAVVAVETADAQYRLAVVVGDGHDIGVRTLGVEVLEVDLGVRDRDE